MFKKRKIREMFDELHEIVGWFGMFAILIAYALISNHFITVDALWYQALNFVGSATLLYTAFKTRAYPVVALNIVWLFIAIIAILSLY